MGTRHRAVFPVCTHAALRLSNALRAALRLGGCTYRAAHPLLCPWRVLTTRPRLRSVTPSLPGWLQSPALQHFSGYTEASLRACCVDMHAALAAAPAAQLQAVRKKYAQPARASVTALPLPSL